MNLTEQDTTHAMEMKKRDDALRKAEAEIVQGRVSFAALRCVLEEAQAELLEASEAPDASTSVALRRAKEAELEAARLRMELQVVEVRCNEAVTAVQVERSLLAEAQVELQEFHETRHKESTDLVFARGETGRSRDREHGLRMEVQRLQKMLEQAKLLHLMPQGSTMQQRPSQLREHVTGKRWADDQAMNQIKVEAPADSTRRVEDVSGIFDIVDANHDGVIDRHEFNVAAEKGTLPLRRSELQGPGHASNLHQPVGSLRGTDEVDEVSDNGIKQKPDKAEPFAADSVTPPTPPRAFGLESLEATGLVSSHTAIPIPAAPLVPRTGNMQQGEDDSAQRALDNNAALTMFEDSLTSRSPARSPSQSPGGHVEQGPDAAMQGIDGGKEAASGEDGASHSGSPSRTETLQWASMIREELAQARAAFEDEKISLLALRGLSQESAVAAMPRLPVSTPSSSSKPPHPIWSESPGTQEASQWASAIRAELQTARETFQAEALALRSLDTPSGPNV